MTPLAHRVVSVHSSGYPSLLSHFGTDLRSFTVHLYYERVRSSPAAGYSEVDRYAKEANPKPSPNRSHTMLFSSLTETPFTAVPL